MRRINPLATLLLIPALCLLGLGGPSAQDEPTPVHHRVRIALHPDEHRLDVMDEIGNAPLVDGSATFRLHAGLTVGCLDSDLALHVDLETEKADTGSGETGGPLAVRTWRVSRKDGKPIRPQRILRLKFQGVIHHPLETEGDEYARSFSRTSGIIDEEGVMLSGGSWWLPAFDDRLLTFDLSINLPREWDAVSQGERTRHEEMDLDSEIRRVVTWTCKHPMEEVYLIAAPFHEFSRTSGNVTAYAFLRSPDEALANKYLDVTAQYIEMYRGLIGPYPFSKFALVENFWETGYGMPSFTLLGSTVIRLPFILHSSYPHEILHNWWGNGVFVEWETGNWCEGLTAYLADHLIKEGRGEGHAYRRDTLGGYRNYVRGEKDFPLTEFRSRHSSATQAVGYGKCLMLWHMLRVQLGDETFAAALQRFYREHQFRRASFSDMERAFSETAGEDLSGIFAQWVERTGAPVLEADVAVDAAGAVELTLRQTQDRDPYDLLVPVAITRRGRSDAETRMVHLSDREGVFRITGDAEVLRVDVDPYFDVFRRLHREEIPPALSGLFGAEEITFVVPEEGADPLAAEWLELARTWQAGETESFRIVRADEIPELPTDRSIWLLGSENRWRETIREALAGRGVDAVPEGGDCFAYVLRHPADPDLVVGWVGSGNAKAIPGLARKLPHYGKYSYLVFTGDEPTNTEKGQWSATASPLVWTAPGEDVERAALPERSALASLAPPFDARALYKHVEFLSEPGLDGRGIGTKGLREAEQYVASYFAEGALDPYDEHGNWIQVWAEPNGPRDRPERMANVIAIIPGTDPDYEGQSVVVGAHYDHLGKGWPDVHAGDEGKLHPGAEDNASGVAVLLELAFHLRESYEPPRTIVFVAFTGEEWGLKGSRHYVQNIKEFPTDQIIGMINLDSVGRLGDRPITVFGTNTALEWKYIAMTASLQTGIPSKSIPDDPGGSDQRAFHEAKVPAVQIFGGMHEDYHRPTDTLDKIDVPGLVKVATFVKEMITYLAERPDPLQSSFTERAAPSEGAGGDRRVSLGTMPDFEYAGPGYRAAAITPGSAAAEAGLQAGDVLLAIDGVELEGLRHYSGILKSHSPGDVILVRYRRGDEEDEVKVTLRAR